MSLYCLHAVSRERAVTRTTCRVRVIGPKTGGRCCPPVFMRHFSTTRDMAFVRAHPRASAVSAGCPDHQTVQILLCGHIEVPPTGDQRQALILGRAHNLLNRRRSSLVQC